MFTQDMMENDFLSKTYNGKCPFSYDIRSNRLSGKCTFYKGHKGKWTFMNVIRQNVYFTKDILGNILFNKSIKMFFFYFFFLIVSVLFSKT